MTDCGWQTACTVAAPPADTVAVWRMPVPADHITLDALKQKLSPHEQLRASAKRIDHKRHEYITGQAMLRLCLSTAVDIAASDIRYRRGPKGKPYLGGELSDHRLHFNISHSGAQVMLAMVLDDEIGVDLEQLNLRTGCERVARRAFSQAELAQLGDLQSSVGRRQFFRMWTAKEAVVKCSGDGIHSGLARFSIRYDGEHEAHISHAEGNQIKVQDYQVVPLLNGDDGHAATLVYAGPRRRVRRWQLSAQQLLKNDGVG